MWTYQIIDSQTDKVIRTDNGFENESDAETQARMEINADTIRGAYIRTLPTPTAHD